MLGVQSLCAQGLPAVQSTSSAPPALTDKLNTGDELNERYPIFERRSSEIGDVNVKHMLRYNITPCEYRDGDNGINITLRVVRPIPPTLDELEVEPELQPHLFHQQGLVMIVGPTGSGKTTTQAAIVRAILEDANSHRKIALFDSPPEFAFYDVPRATALLSQHDVPKHIRSYALGIRNSLRRMTRVIVVGESRDRETMEAALEGAKTGQALYTTGHAGSCVEAISRFADMFTPEERLPKVFELVDSLRVMVVQKLLPRCDVEKRVAIREFLVFDRDVRDRLREGTTLVEVEKILRGLVETRGQSMLTAAQKVFAKGMITAETLGVFEREAKVALPEGLGLSF